MHQREISLAHSESDPQFQAQAQLLSWLPLVVDGTAALTLLWLTPILTLQLRRQQEINVGNALLFVGAFMLQCTGIYLIRKLSPLKMVEHRLAPLKLSERTWTVLGVLFAVAFTLAVGHQLGYLDALLVADARALGEGEAAVFFVLAPGAWLALGLFYVLIVRSTFTPAVHPGDVRYTVFAALGLVATQAMLLLAVAQLAALSGSAPHSLLAGMIIALLLLLLFATPRLFFLERSPHARSIVSLLLLIGWATWLASAG